jgi:uncharacterized protein (UPF0333 family)
MINKIKLFTILTLTILLTACGGAGGGTIYQTTFNATVSGLDAGETITVVASLYADKTLTQVTNVSQNGAWSTTINLPDGKVIAFDTKIEITQQPAGKICSVTYLNSDVTSSINTIKCVPVSAAGLYTGKFFSSTGQATLLILNDGSYWMWLGTDNAGVSAYSAVIQSDSGKSTSNTYASTSGVDVGSNPLKNNLSLLGTYISNTSFTGALTDNNVPYSLTLSALPAKTYQFSDLPTLTKITGNYFGRDDTFNISPTGILSGSTSNGCQFVGTVAPKTTGENLYAATITYGGSPCISVVQGDTLSGVLILHTTLLGTQILGAVINNAKTSGKLLITTKK